MIDKFEVGKWYKYTGRRITTFNPEGLMDFVLDGKPHLCTRVKGTTGADFEGHRRDSDHPWYWDHTLSDWQLVKRPFIKGKVYRYTGNGNTIFSRYMAYMKTGTHLVTNVEYTGTDLPKVWFADDPDDRGYWLDSDDFAVVGESPFIKGNYCLVADEKYGEWQPAIYLTTLTDEPYPIITVATNQESLFYKGEKYQTQVWRYAKELSNESLAVYQKLKEAEKRYIALQEEFAQLLKK